MVFLNIFWPLRKNHKKLSFNSKPTLFIDLSKVHFQIMCTCLNVWPFIRLNSKLDSRKNTAIHKVPFQFYYRESSSIVCLDCGSIFNGLTPSIWFIQLTTCLCLLGNTACIGDNFPILKWWWQCRMCKASGNDRLQRIFWWESDENLLLLRFNTLKNDVKTFLFFYLLSFKCNTAHSSLEGHTLHFSLWENKVCMRHISRELEILHRTLIAKFFLLTIIIVVVEVLITNSSLISSLLL